MPEIKNNKGDQEMTAATYNYKARSNSGDEGDEAMEECAICLSKIEVGEEIRESRCCHIFHKDCLDRWVFGYGHSSCPLCRDSLGRRRLISDLGLEVLVFKFSSFTSSDTRDAWWLR